MSVKSTGRYKDIRHAEAERQVGISVRRFDPRQSGLERWFGPLEAAVMKVIWDNPDRRLIVKYIRRELIRFYGKEDIGYTTVMTTMVRLWERGILNRKRDGLAYVYQPVCTEDEFLAIQVNAILRSLEEVTASDS